MASVRQIYTDLARLERGEKVPKTAWVRCHSPVVLAQANARRCRAVSYERGEVIAGCTLELFTRPASLAPCK